MELREIVWGSFDYGQRRYVVTNGATPNMIRVFAGDSHTGAMVCSLHGLDGRPETLWNSTYLNSTSRAWRDGFSYLAERTYLTGRTRRATTRTCDG